MLHLKTSDFDSPVFRTRFTSQRAEAAKWFRMAATGGHSRGQHNRAVAYHNDRGVERDTTEAIRWYLMAAEHTCFPKGMSGSSAGRSGMRLSE